MEDHQRDVNERADPRARLEAAALRVVGDIGYRAATVQLIGDRAGVGRSLFYRYFAGKEECYARAHAAALDRLTARLLTACAARDSWAAGLVRALGELADFIATDPELATGVLTQGRLAGESALAKRAEVKELLVAAIDSVRGAAPPDHEPPPIAAEFVFAAIEEVAVDVLSRSAPAEFARAVPDLTFLAVGTYFGSAAARQALRDEWGDQR